MREKIADSNGIKIWSESMGDVNHPTLLLIMGAGSQAIHWPPSFCRKLLQLGYNVIRYDHRDVGLSSLINFEENPYTINDLVDDALAVLDAHKIEKAHIVGASMGGFIAQLLAARHPSRVLSLTSFASTPDHRPLVAPLLGQDPRSFSLEAMTDECLAFLQKVHLTTPKTPQEALERQVAYFSFLNGNSLEVDQAAIQQLCIASFKRCPQTRNAFNHTLATAKSEDRLNEIKKISVPSLIIHGSEDPLIPVSHARAAAEAIQDAELVIIKKMGHTLHPQIEDEVLEAINRLARLAINTPL